MAKGTLVTVAMDMGNTYNVAMATGTTFVTIAMNTQVWYTRVQRPTRHSIGISETGGHAGNLSLFPWLHLVTFPNVISAP